MSQQSIPWAHLSELKRTVVESTLTLIWDKQEVPQVTILDSSEVTGIPPSAVANGFVTLDIGNNQIGEVYFGVSEITFGTAFGGRRCKVSIPYNNFIRIAVRDISAEVIMPTYVPMEKQEPVPQTKRPSLSLVK